MKSRRSWLTLFPAIALLCLAGSGPIAASATRFPPGTVLFERAESGTNPWEFGCTTDAHGTISCSGGGNPFQPEIHIPAGADHVLVVVHVSLTYRVSKGDVASVQMGLFHPFDPRDRGIPMQPGRFLVSSPDPKLPTTSGFEWTLVLDDAAGKTFTVLVSVNPEDRNKDGSWSARGGSWAGDVEVLTPRA